MKTGGAAVLGGVGDVLGEIELLYRHRYPAFLRVAVAISGDEQHGGDAVQDAFVGVVRSRHTLRRRASLESFIWRSVINAASSRRERPRDIPSAEAIAPEADEHDERVRNAIAALPERQRLVLFLRYFADLDYHQIARVMGIRPGTVAASLTAARAAVKARLDEKELACP